MQVERIWNKKDKKIQRPIRSPFFRKKRTFMHTILGEREHNLFSAVLGLTRHHMSIVATIDNDFLSEFRRDYQIIIIKLIYRRLVYPYKKRIMV